MTRWPRPGKRGSPATCSRQETSLEGIPMRTARLAVTADTLGVPGSHGHDTGSEPVRCAPRTSPPLESSAHDTATPAPAATPPRPAGAHTTRPFTTWSADASCGVSARPGTRSHPSPTAGKTASRRPSTLERPGHRLGTPNGRRGRRVREQILVTPAPRGLPVPPPWRAHHCPHTSYSVSSARRGAILQRTTIGCNTYATGTNTYPIAFREASRTRCKSSLFDAEWLARILFAGRGYLERGR